MICILVLVFVYFCDRPNFELPQLMVTGLDIRCPIDYPTAVESE